LRRRALIDHRRLLHDVDPARGLVGTSQVRVEGGAAVTILNRLGAAGKIGDEEAIEQLAAVGHKLLSLRHLETRDPESGRRQRVRDRESPSHIGDQAQQVIDVDRTAHLVSSRLELGRPHVVVIGGHRSQVVLVAGCACLVESGQPARVLRSRIQQPPDRPATAGEFLAAQQGPAFVGHRQHEKRALAPWPTVEALGIGTEFLLKQVTHRLDSEDPVHRVPPDLVAFQSDTAQTVPGFPGQGAGAGELVDVPLRVLRRRDLRVEDLDRPPEVDDPRPVFVGGAPHYATSRRPKGQARTTRNEESPR
jgi:hypothetical protein